MNTLFTTGYALWSIEEILALLEEHQAILVDIRSSPRSSKSCFDRYALVGSLGNQYRHTAALGNVNYRNPDRPIVLRDEDLGLEGLAQLLEDTNVVIMCGCRDLDKCHRLTVTEKMEKRFSTVVEHINV